MSAVSLLTENMTEEAGNEALCLRRIGGRLMSRPADRMSALRIRRATSSSSRVR
jgi:hypothetical protein